MIIIKSVSFENNNIIVQMSNGKIIETPINYYPNLSKGTKTQMDNYEIKGGGRWIHWEELDEDLSAEGFLSMEKTRH
ncbi:DUF2442 domain-containing protein [Mucilaginibacter sp.]|uniref:DUF2442 domain-containing protein n=1 Tax=Mucilaginibacter sp. TaxID=1882438 RepID=UPI00283C8E0B|nr:DUF2442 domain-containing protein [Mucilaginibacter sp.]MDR3695854.1 DUF2442 domain-containing protein [Mucilaginibacter sp.]